MHPFHGKPKLGKVSTKAEYYATSEFAEEVNFVKKILVKIGIHNFQSISRMII
jgi:hypothetical protein